MNNNNQNTDQQKSNLTNAEELKQKVIRKTKNYISCISASAFTIDSLHQDQLDIETIIDKLVKSASNLKSGNTQEIETMLITQAHTLNALFHRTLSQIGTLNMVNQVQVFSEIAFKAQNQCRKTLAVLAELKNPKRATFIKQQNNAVNQQVNNADRSKNEKESKLANELLEVKNEQWLDERAKITSISTNPEMAAVEISRGKNKRG